MQDNVFFTDALITADELTIIFPAGGHFSVIADNLEGDTNLKRVRIDKWVSDCLCFHDVAEHAHVASVDGGRAPNV